MAPEERFWYRVGYALERAVLPSPPKERRLASLAGREPRVRSRRAASPSASRKTPLSAGREDGDGERLAPDNLVSAGIAVLAGGLLDAWQPRRKTGFTRLLWAGAAGAAAALLLDVVRPLLRGQPELPIFDRGTGDRLLAGVGQGLIYGAVVEPRVPGPSLLKGALYGSAEYAADAAGGLSSLLGAHAPQRRLLFVGRILEEIDPRDRMFVEHLAFGIALALLYGSSPSSNGILPEDDDE
jgi:hypothetical protein